MILVTDHLSQCRATSITQSQDSPRAVDQQPGSGTNGFKALKDNPETQWVDVFNFSYLEAERSSLHQWGEPPCRASPSGRPGRTRRGDKVGFRFRLHGRSTSPSRQSPQVERESDQSTRKRPSPTQQFTNNPNRDSRHREARFREWRQVLTRPRRRAA